VTTAALLDVLGIDRNFDLNARPADPGERRPQKQEIPDVDRLEKGHRIHHRGDDPAASMAARGDATGRVG
jgi:hypothetical protein